ncbi:MAG: hypothetical protein U0325_25585 [Polyangiales bacterium]
MKLLPMLRPMVVAAALTALPALAFADPVTLTAASMQLTPPPGWTATTPGPQVALFRRGDAVSVDVMMPALDARNTEASLTAEFLRAVNPRWSGPAQLRVVWEQRGTMRRGTAQHNGREERFIFVAVPINGRLLLAAIYIAPNATREQEGEAHQIVSSLRPVGS